MENGYSKWSGVVLLLLLGFSTAFAQYQVKATTLTHDVKDLSQRDSKVFDQNGERCALSRNCSRSISALSRLRSARTKTMRFGCG